MPELEPAISPDRHLLLIDVGNSRVKWIGAVWSARSNNWDLDVTTFGEGTSADFESSLEAGEIMPPEEILVSAVPGSNTARDIERLVALKSAAPPRRLSSSAEIAGIKNGYLEPEKLGTDRWMAIVGAARHHDLPVVVMDLGTREHP